MATAALHAPSIQRLDQQFCGRSPKTAAVLQRLLHCVSARRGQIATSSPHSSLACVRARTLRRTVAAGEKGLMRHSSHPQAAAGCRWGHQPRTLVEGRVLVFDDELHQAYADADRMVLIVDVPRTPLARAKPRAR